MVSNFRCLRQTSAKSDFDYCISMEFENESDYSDYYNHPQHARFLEDLWHSEVTNFMELDYVSHEVLG